MGVQWRVAAAPEEACSLGGGRGGRRVRVWIAHVSMQTSSHVSSEVEKHYEEMACTTINIGRDLQ